MSPYRFKILNYIDRKSKIKLDRIIAERTRRAQQEEEDRLSFVEFWNIFRKQVARNDISSILKMIGKPFEIRIQNDLKPRYIDEESFLLVFREYKKSDGDLMSAVQDSAKMDITNTDHAKKIGFDWRVGQLVFRKVGRQWKLAQIILNETLMRLYNYKKVSGE